MGDYRSESRTVGEKAQAKRTLVGQIVGRSGQYGANMGDYRSDCRTVGKYSRETGDYRSECRAIGKYLSKVGDYRSDRPTAATKSSINGRTSNFRTVGNKSVNSKRGDCRIAGRLGKVRANYAIVGSSHGIRKTSVAGPCSASILEMTPVAGTAVGIKPEHACGSVGKNVKPMGRK